MRAFFWYFIIVKICCFFIIRFYLIMLLTFFQISLNFSKKISSFIKKDIHLISSKSLLYALIFGRNMHKGLICLASLQPIKYLKSSLPKEILLDTTVLLIYILSIEIGLLYWWNLYISISALSNFFIHFYLWF